MVRPDTDHACECDLVSAPTADASWPAQQPWVQCPFHSHRSPPATATAHPIHDCSQDRALARYYATHRGRGATI
eukprot:402466-Prymnesium_polylepis.1